MPPPRKVALLIETSNAYGRGLLHGIEAYRRAHGPWLISFSEHSRGERPPAWIVNWDGHGVIARIENEAMARALAPLGIPIVDMSAARLLPEVPFVESDDAAAARLAADHLIERGFRTFAFCGDPRFKWAAAREAHFARQIRDRGFPCYTWKPESRRTSEHDGTTELIGNWLSKLPKPLAVFACYDSRGLQVVNACQLAGLRIPDEVAVLGVDNDDLLCALSEPPLSSVVLNAQRTGYEAAALLDRMMNGEQVSPEGTFVPPLGVVARQSTDVLAVEDKNIARAVRFIRENACRGIGVADVVRSSGPSRRPLEMKFRQLLGRTPHDEIARVQLEQVKHLLTTTDLPLSEIAERTGFAHTEYLSAAFKQRVGLPPSHYRAQHRPNGSSSR